MRTWVGGNSLCTVTDLERTMCAHCLGHTHNPPVVFEPWGGVQVEDIKPITIDATLQEYLRDREDPRTAGASPEIDLEEA